MKTSTEETESRAPASVDLGGGLRLHCIQTGWVSVKRAHRYWPGPAALRFAAIVASRRWTEQLPIFCWAIEHPDGVVVVDTGETHRVAEPDWFGCDPGTQWFYERNLRFAVESEQAEIGPQLREIGIEPERVSKVVLTHLHSDHAGGLRWFPEAEIVVPEAD